MSKKRSKGENAHPVFLTTGRAARHCQVSIYALFDPEGSRQIQERLGTAGARGEGSPPWRPS